VALTAYFIIAEALTNVAKHSDARAVQIVLQERADVLHLLVTDDGRGGADPAGMGLRGLADRASAAGGVMMVSSPTGGPTRIEARLPCE
jgi:signal transduction histidine kinase